MGVRFAERTATRGKYVIAIVAFLTTPWIWRTMLSVVQNATSSLIAPRSVHVRSVRGANRDYGNAIWSVIVPQLRRKSPDKRFDRGAVSDLSLKG